MALTNFTLTGVGAATPAFVSTTASTPLRVGLDDLLYSPDEYQQDVPAQPSENEPFIPPNQRRPKVRKRAGTAYLPPANQYMHYQNEAQQNPYAAPLHTQVYPQNSRLNVQIENQRVKEVNTPYDVSGQYDNTGQYVHDPTGDYDYEQKRMNQRPSGQPYNPGYADAPYPPAMKPNPPSSRRFDENSNQNVNNFNFNRPLSSTPAPTRPPSNQGSKTGGSETGQNPPERPRGFTKVETGGSGGKTQLHAVLDYDDEDYYDDPDPGKTNLFLTNFYFYQIFRGDSKTRNLIVSKALIKDVLVFSKLNFLIVHLLLNFEKININVLVIYIIQPSFRLNP